MVLMNIIIKLLLEELIMKWGVEIQVDQLELHLDIIKKNLQLLEIMHQKTDIYHLHLDN